VTLPAPYYQDDFVTIYHGDCYEIAPLIEGVDALITDPPYGVSEECNRGEKGRGFLKRANDFADVIGDSVPFDPSVWLLYPTVVLWGANNFSHLLPPTRGWLVWDKRGDVLPDDNGDCEIAWTNKSRPIRQFTHLWNGCMKATERGYTVHPTQKPVALMRWCVEQFTKPNDLILDPFMGSGPLARACKDLGRRYVGIEIEEQYVRVAADRCRQEVLL
jgi:site-specific DNA-methyltransferase (adenine-specific)